MIKALIAAGDVGGARAILAALEELSREGCEIDVLDNGYLGKESVHDWKRVRLGDQTTANSIDSQYDVCVFGTSVKDPLPLKLAQVCRDAGVPTVCVLDNWMNYRSRLVTAYGNVFWPNVYAVMDEFAKEEAVNDGVPPSIIRITGHPALAALGCELGVSDPNAIQQRLLKGVDMRDGSKKLVVFVSEPVAKDQGCDMTSSGFRGYTEKGVLRLLCDNLQFFKDQVQVGLLAHPRQDSTELESSWNGCRGGLSGSLLNPTTGREAVIAADGVCGMASILLFESMLIGKPTISLQPNLRLPDLEFLKKKGLVSFVVSEEDAPQAIQEWLDGVLMSGSSPAQMKDELELHANAPSTLARLILDTAAQKDG